MAVKIGSLEIDLRANSAQFIQGMAKARGSIQSFAGSFSKLQVLLVGGASVAGFSAAANAAINFGTELTRVNRVLGENTKFFSEMDEVVKRSGLNFDQFVDSMLNQQEKLGEAAVLGTGELAESLEILGLNAKNLLGGGVEKTFQALVDSLGRVEDNAVKVTLANMLWSDSGNDLLRVVNLQTEGLAAAREEASRLGATMTEEAAQSMADFQKVTTDATTATANLVSHFVAGVLPAVNDLISPLVDVGEGFSRAGKIGQAFGNVLNGIRIAANAVVLAVDDTVKNLDSLNTAAGLVLTLDFEGAAKERERFAADQRQRALNFLEETARLAGTFPEFDDFVPSTAKPRAPEFDLDRLRNNLAGPDAARKGALEAESAARRAANDALREQNRLQAEGLRILESTRTPNEQHEATLMRLQELRDLNAISQETFNRAVANSVAELAASTDAMDAQVESFEEHRERLADEGERVFEATRTPLENVEKQFERLRELYEAGAIDLETFNRAMAQASDLQSGFMDSIEQGLTGLVTGTMTARQAFASMAADILSQLARIAAQDAFGKIFNSRGSTSGGGGIGAFFSSLVGGLFGAQNGASFSVAGTGGADSQVVAFRATPGEQVSVGAGGGSPITVVQNMTFSSGPGDRETLDQVGFQAGEAIREAMARNG